MIINAFAIWNKDLAYQCIVFNKHLINLMQNTNKRLITVSGVSSLYVDETKTKFLLDANDWLMVLEDIFAIIKLTHDVYKLYSSSQNVNWTLFSPVGEFHLASPATNNWTLSTDYLILNNKGKSYLTDAGDAKIIANEIKNKKFESKIYCCFK